MPVVRVAVPVVRPRQFSPDLVAAGFRDPAHPFGFKSQFFTAQTKRQIRCQARGGAHPPWQMDQWNETSPLTRRTLASRPFIFHADHEPRRKRLDAIVDSELGSDFLRGEFVLAVESRESTSKAKTMTICVNASLDEEA